MVLEHDFKLFPELTNSQMRIFYWDSPHKQITQDFMAKVVKVTDGDTIRVETDFRDFSFPIRFLDIDAPEMETKSGERSQKWLDDLIMGEEIEVKINPNLRVEKWGRLLGEIYHTGFNINKLSVLMGYSVKFGDATENVATAR